MKSIYFLLVMGMLLVACGGKAQETATTIPEPTDPPEPTGSQTWRVGRVGFRIRHPQPRDRHR
jgi:hypothetical protein